MSENMSVFSGRKGKKAYHIQTIKLETLNVNTKAYFKGIRLLLRIIIMKIESDGTRIFYLSHSIFFIKGIGMALAVNGRKYADFQNCK